MPLVAHFTPAELPGTVAILLMGAVLGIAVVRHQRFIAAAVLAMAVVTTLSALGDGLGWSPIVRVSVDVAALVSGLVMLRAMWLRLPEHVKR